MLGFREHVNFEQRQKDEMIIWDELDVIRRKVCGRCGDKGT